MKQTISVRGLVEYISRSGDLDTRFSGRSTAVEGTKTHQVIQSQMDADYEPEVMLRTTIELDGVSLTVQGRADGIYKDGETIMVDEIKSTSGELADIDDAGVPVHWAQGKCYAYIHGLDLDARDGDVYGVQLTYVKQHTYETKRIQMEFTFDELRTFFEETVSQYIRWLYERRDWLRVRDRSIKAADFPFKRYRKGQRELSVAVYQTIREGRCGFYQAPTGIGKTMSTLFPGIKALGQGLSDRIFYLTAKTITRTVAQGTADILSDRGIRLRRLTLTAKDKICFEPGSACNPDECSYAKGHFDRVNDAIWDVLSRLESWDRDAIEATARDYHVCPFEFSLDLALWADLVICDYNYAFDPRVYLRRFFDESSDDFLFLVDEAHNLVDRAREMYSAELNKEMIMEVKRVLPKWNLDLIKYLERMNRTFLEWKKNCEETGYFVDYNPPDKIYPQVRMFLELAETWLLENQSAEAYEIVLELYFQAMRFMRIYEIYDDCYISLYEKKGKDVRMRMYCIDPSYNLSEKLKNAKSAIFFSATLTPLKYYRRILGGCDEDAILAFDSPFDPRRRLMMQTAGISTRYKDREHSMQRLVDYIRTFVEGHTGNYIVFFPSYKYMHDAFDMLESLMPQVAFIVQETEMGEGERERFLETFQPDPSETLVALCVLGGIFSEGIDLIGNRLTGVAIVGVGLPTVNLENDLIRDYFDREESAGFAFAYAFPGINKVMQAVGRLIRSEEDAGLILLLDDRYSNRYYRNMLPHDWNAKVTREKEIGSQIKAFWKDIEKHDRETQAT